MSTVAPTSSTATSKKTNSDPAYAPTHLGATASGRNEPSSISRARPGLRGDDHSVVGGSGCDGVIGVDPACGGQHDLPKHDKQSHASRKKAPLKSWRHKLNVCRYPSIESIDSFIGDVHPNVFRRTSSDHGSLAEAFASAGAGTHKNSMVSSARGGEIAAGNSNEQPTTNKRLTRNSPFCPCFSPTDSDLDEEEPVAVASSGSQRPMTEQNAPSRTSSRRQQIIHVARDLRSRLVVAGEAANQTAGPADVRRIGDGMTMSDQPYPVHTTVEYTHYLVPDMLQITNAPYYWGVMDRFEAEKKLDGKPEGTFLLRDSAQSDYLFSVSFRRYQRTLHARIEEMNHRFSFDSYDTAVFSAPTVTQLIENYKDPTRCLFFEPQLTHPLHRNFVFPLQHLCRAVIASRLNYNDLAKLPAPRKLKDYLREYHYKQPIRITNNETAAERSGADDK